MRDEWWVASIGGSDYHTPKCQSTPPASCVMSGEYCEIRLSHSKVSKHSTCIMRDEWWVASIVRSGYHTPKCQSTPPASCVMSNEWWVLGDQTIILQSVKALHLHMRVEWWVASIGGSGYYHTLKCEQFAFMRPALCQFCFKYIKWTKREKYRWVGQNHAYTV